MSGPATARSSGWYPDPDDPTRVRWWNGVGWSDAVREHPEVPAPVRTDDNQRGPWLFRARGPVLGDRPWYFSPSDRRGGLHCVDARAALVLYGTLATMIALAMYDQFRALSGSAAAPVAVMVMAAMLTMLLRTRWVPAGQLDAALAAARAGERGPSRRLITLGLGAVVLLGIGWLAATTPDGAGRAGGASSTDTASGPAGELARGSYRSEVLAVDDDGRGVHMAGPDGARHWTRIDSPQVGEQARERLGDEVTWFWVRRDDGVVLVSFDAPPEGM